LKYTQKIGDASATGTFQVVGESCQSTKDTVERVYSKVKELLASKHLDFSGEVDVVLDSVIEFEANASTLSKCLVFNLVESDGSVRSEAVSLMDIPLDEDVEIARSLRSSRIGTGRLLVTTRDEGPHV
jgi:hypothetical protein